MIILTTGFIHLSIYRLFVSYFFSQEIKALAAIFGKCLNYKSGLRILILPPEVPFFVVQKQSLLPKVPIFETKKMALLVAKSKF